MKDLLARYSQAEAVFAHKLKDLVASPKVAPNWVEDTDMFWYENQIARGVEHVPIDAAAATRRPLFDQAKITAALGDRSYLVLRVLDGAVSVLAGKEELKVSLDTYGATVVGPSPAIHESRSPTVAGRSSPTTTTSMPATSKQA